MVKIANWKVSPLDGDTFVWFDAVDKVKYVVTVGRDATGKCDIVTATGNGKLVVSLAPDELSVPTEHYAIILAKDNCEIVARGGKQWTD